MDKILRNKLNHRLTGLRSAALYMLAAFTMAIIMVCGASNSVSASALSIRLNGLSYNHTHTPLINPDPFNMDLSDKNGTTAEKHVSCYPNPAISYINFKFDKSVPKEARLFVFSFTGKKMEELAINSQILKVTLDNYYRGLYVYQLRSASGAILESGKFQVRN